jgi:sugar lactone lactonase YvrE
MMFVASPARLCQSLRLRFSLILLLLAGLLLPSAARAQVTFDNVAVTLASFPTASLSPIAVDAQGDAFFVASDSGVNTLYEVPANGALTALNSSFPFLPIAIAVNPGGSRLYFIYQGATATCNGGYVYLATAPVSAGTTPTNMPGCFSLPGFGSVYPISYSDLQGLAVDPSGNLWLADYGGGSLFEILAPVGASSVPTNYVALTSGQPWGIAVNGNGTVYISINEYPGGNIVPYLASVPASSLTHSISGSPATPSNIVANVPSIASGLTIDPSGNLYIGGGSSPDSRVSGSSLVPVFSNFVNGTTGLATDSNGIVFIAGNDGTNSSVIELTNKAANFGSLAVGSTSSALLLNFTVNAGTTIGSIAVLTQGAPNLDFTDAGGSTCVAQSYPSEAACTVNVQFTPKAPGLRMGAVVFYSGAGNTGTVLATVPVYGAGSGPQVGYLGAAPATQSSGYAGPVAVTVDAAGNVYVADNNSPASVFEASPGGTLVRTITGFNQARGVAVDGAGNLYIPQWGSPVGVYKVALDGTTTTVGSGFLSPSAVAVDGPGNVYVCDNGKVYKITPAGVQTTVAGSFYAPDGVAVDAAGDLYVSDYGNPSTATPPAIYMLAPNGTQTSVGSGFTQPESVAVDGAGDVFVLDGRAVNTPLIEVPAGGTQSTLSTSLGFPLAVATDALGNVYVASYNGNNILKLDRANIPSENFLTSTTAGTTDTTDGTKTVQVANLGNQPLNVSGLSYPADFPEAAGVLTACTSSISLNPGQECDLPIQFAPTALATGALSEKVTLTDNNLNATSAMQSVVVNGTVTPPTAPAVTFSTTVVNFGNVNVGATATQQVTLTNTGTATLSFTGLVTGPNASLFSKWSNCGPSPIATLAPGAFCTINVVFKPMVTGPASAALTLTDNASDSPQSVSLSGTGIASAVTLSTTLIAFGNQKLNSASAAQQVTLTNSGTATLTYSGAFTGANASMFSKWSNCSGALAPGASCTVNIVFTPTATGPASAALTLTDNASDSPQSVSLSGTGVTPAVTLSTTSLSFGNQAISTASAAQAVTITNSGTSALTFSGTLTGLSASSFSKWSNCTGPLAPGASCTANIVFTPTAAGPASAALTLTDNASDSPQSVTLSGTGIAPAVTLSTTLLNFGVQPVNTTSAAQQVTLTNSGTATLRFSGLLTGPDAALFSKWSNCTGPLAPGASCTVNIVFKPTTTNPASAALTITDNASDSPQTVNLIGGPPVI